MKRIVYVCVLLLQCYGIRAESKDNTKILQEKFAFFENELKTLKRLIKSVKRTNGQQSGDVLNKLEGLYRLFNESCNGGSLNPNCLQAEGFIHIPGSNQCYKVLLDQERSWTDARQKCISKGLAFAEPKNPIQTRKHLNGIYGDVALWVGGRGNGKSVQYLRGGGQLRRGDSLWISGHPDSHGYTTAQCLIMSAISTHLESDPSAPYFTYDCSDTSLAYALCEVPVVSRSVVVSQ